jgi:ketosteroid isomerase-like protein
MRKGSSMSLSAEEIARAFSSHDFAAATPYLADDVAWILVGEESPIVGKPAVVDLCKRSAADLEQVTTSFLRFRVVVAEDCVIAESLAQYVATDGTSIVASCDLYDFSDGLVTEITSYNIELTGTEADSTAHMAG